MADLAGYGAGERASQGAVWGLCLFGALATGVSGFNADSNHPTYLPPALNWLDPAYLAGDWWLQSASHYHYAFFALVAGLAKLGVLEAGLAAINIAAIAVALHACHRVFVSFRLQPAVAALALLVALLIATRSFAAAGNTYLFSPSLQPSTIATAATLAAMAAYLSGRPGRSGLWLLVAGLFHVNFLVADIALFGTAHALTLARQRPWTWRQWRAGIVDMLKLVGPCLVLLAAMLPLILSVGNQPLDAAGLARSDWIFFRFAVPYHYYPLNYLPELRSLFAWQVLGLLWTARAVADPAARRAAWSLQVALVAVLWVATGLTTLVFIPEVSRLFLWRLAPFAALLAAALAIAGALRVIAGEATAPETRRRDMLTLLASFAALSIFLLPSGRIAGQVIGTVGLAPGALALLALFALASLRLLRASDFPARPLPRAAALCGVLAFALLTQPNDSQHPRYPLLAKSEALRDEDSLHRFARQSTEPGARFLAPPSLEMFRLETGRPIVVDFKAFPIDRSSQLEWYSRLEAISGKQNPRTMFEVLLGYVGLDAERLDTLRRAYGLRYAVLLARQDLQPPGWVEVFRNRSYRVLEYRGQ